MNLPQTVAEITDAHVRVALDQLVPTGPRLVSKAYPTHPMAERLLLLLWAERQGIQTAEVKPGIAVGAEHLESEPENIPTTEATVERIARAFLVMERRHYRHPNNAPAFGGLSEDHRERLLRQARTALEEMAAITAEMSPMGRRVE